MLNQTDLNKIEVLLDQKLEEKLDQKLEEKFNEKLKYFPTKDEFFKRMDQIMGELQTIREEMTIGFAQIDRHAEEIEEHEVRLSKIEKHIHLPVSD